MKNVLKSIALVCVLALAACEKDEGKLPNISLKTGGSYISATTSVPAGTNATIGIDASKAEEEDVLKKFNISKSVNNGTAGTVFSKDLSGSEGDTYSYDYVATVGSTVGDLEKYTFTVTNRDGLVNQVDVTLIVQ